MRSKPFLLVLILFFTVSFSSQAKSLPGGVSEYKMKVRHYAISLKVFPNLKSIQGTNVITFEMECRDSNIVLDLDHRLKIESLTFKDKELKFKRSLKKIYIQLGNALNKGEKGVLKVRYSGEPEVAIQAPWKGGFVWSQDKEGNAWVGLACESKGASIWLPCRDKWDNEVDSMSMELIVPEGLTGVSNGKLIRVANESGGYRSFLWKTLNPINHYNISVNVGKYVHFNDVGGLSNKLSLDYYVLSYNLEKAKKHFLEVDSMLDIFEKTFGPYPFYEDGYKLVETPYWGMEHQSCVAYGNNYKYHPFGFDFIIVHESGHEWFANSITARDPADMWIHESFTTYTEFIYLEQRYDIGLATDYLMTQKAKIVNKRTLLGPIGIDYHGWKDNDIYYKGSWMLHTLRNSVSNDSIWFKILYGMGTKFSHQLTDTRAVVNYMDSMAGGTYQPFFKQYLSRTSLPVLKLQVSKNKSGKTILKYKWKGVENGFSMNVYINAISDKIKIVPGEKIQELILPDNFNPEWLLELERRYLIKVQLKY
ncbi:MAG TPA: M1 family aminopeptidase [Bacteroidia bacterium]